MIQQMIIERFEMPKDNRDRETTAEDAVQVSDNRSFSQSQGSQFDQEHQTIQIQFFQHVQAVIDEFEQKDSQEIRVALNQHSQYTSSRKKQLCQSQLNGKIGSPDQFINGRNIQENRFRDSCKSDIDPIMQKEQMDLAELYSNKQRILKTLRFIKENEQMYCNLEMDRVKRFVSSYSMKLLIAVLPDQTQLKQLVSYFRQKLKGRFGRQRQNALNDTDQVFRSYVQEIQAQNKPGSSYIVLANGQKIKLLEAMRQNEHIFDETSKLRQLFLKTKHLIQQSIVYQSGLGINYDNKILRKRVFNEHLRTIQTPNAAKLCCCPFFFKDSNIYDPNINKIRFAVLGSIKKINQQEAKNMIVKQICGLLNSGGGTLLFDCQRQYFNVIPKGSSMIEPQKENIIRNIKSITQNIYPGSNLMQNILVSFVPVMKDNLTKDERDNLEDKYIPGVYVTRLVVRPSKKQQQYYYKVREEFKTSFRFKSLLDGQNYFRQLAYQPNRMREEVEFLQQNWEQYYATDSCFEFDHEICQCPHKGSPVEDQSTFIEPEATLEKKYEHTSAMAVKVQYADKISERLKEKYKIDCQIFPRFKDYKFKFAPAILIVYHSISFQQLQDIVSSNVDFKFEGRNVMLAEVTDHVKLVQRLNRNSVKAQTLKDLQKWVDIQFAGQGLRVEMMKHKNELEQTEYYLRTGSKTANLFIYLLLNSNGQKSVLKNPNYLRSSFFIGRYR